MNEYGTYESSGILAGVGFGFIIFYLAIIAVAIAGMWKAFEKAGKPGWAAIIPIYNIYIMIEIVGKPTIWLLWCLLPCVNFIFVIWLYNLISKSYGKIRRFYGWLSFTWIYFLAHFRIWSCSIFRPISSRSSKWFWQQPI
jgi:hypothetical protein